MGTTNQAQIILILEGSVLLCARGKETQTVGPGSVIGDEALHEQPYRHSAIVGAKEGAKLLCISVDDFNTQFRPNFTEKGGGIQRAGPAVDEVKAGAVKAGGMLTGKLQDFMRDMAQIPRRQRNLQSVVAEEWQRLEPKHMPQRVTPLDLTAQPPLRLTRESRSAELDTEAPRLLLEVETSFGVRLASMAPSATQARRVSDHSVGEPKAEHVPFLLQPGPGTGCVNSNVWSVPSVTVMPPRAEPPVTVLPEARASTRVLHRLSYQAGGACSASRASVKSLEDNTSSTALGDADTGRSLKADAISQMLPQEGMATGSLDVKKFLDHRKLRRIGAGRIMSLLPST